MNRKIALFTCGLTALCFLGPRADAADENGLFYDFGRVSCGDFTHDLIQPKISQKMAANVLYISGWLSAYNAYTPKTYNIIGDLTLDSVIDWLAEYCKQNRNETMQSGLLAITQALKPNRALNFKAETLK